MINPTPLRGRFHFSGELPLQYLRKRYSHEHQDRPWLQSQLEQEIKTEQTKGVIEQAIESAEAIRENLLAVKGEKFAKVVEISVMVQKRTKLGAVLLTFVENASENFNPLHRHLISHADASLGAHIMATACDLAGFIGSDFDAQEMMEWSDRILKAEADGIHSMEKQLFGKED